MNPIVPNNIVSPFFCIFVFFSMGCQFASEEQVESVVSKETISWEETDIIPEYHAEQMVVLIDQPSVVQELQKQKYSLSQVFPQPSEQILLKNDELWKDHEGYRLLMTHLGARIDDIAQNKIKRPLVRELHDALQYPSGNVGRYFDTRWLSSRSGFFQLIGIVNRLDKQDFYSDGGCGDIRFIYRLAYEQEGVSSRLPFTMNVVWRPKTKTCDQAARAWSISEELERQNFEDPKWIQQHLLPPEQFEFEKIEINLQIIRFPSGLETDFAGQALYLLRVYDFELVDGHWTLLEKGLENTPDVQRISQDPVLFEQLLSFMTENVSKIDQGSYLLPENLWAKEVLSYSTAGINRIANRPFSVIKNDQDTLLSRLQKAKIDWKSEFLQWIQAPESLIDRLNNGSCQGCHQSSTTAGFHFLGEPDTRIDGVTNRLQIPVSFHFLEEQSRRKNYIAQLASQQPVDLFRPHSLFTKAEQGVNDVCIPEESLSFFVDTSSFSCPNHTSCVVVSKDPMAGLQYGSCVSEEENIKAGESCIHVELSPKIPDAGELYNFHNYDRTMSQNLYYSLSKETDFTTQSYNCRPTRIGVPLGRTYRKCTKSEKKFEDFFENGSIQKSKSLPSEICAVVGGRKFDACVEKDFHSCLSNIVARGMVDTCSSSNFCREDYICQMLPYQLSGVEEAEPLSKNGIGFCTPTYFMFQLRLDGHPIPL